MEWLQKHFLEQPNKRFLDDQTFGDVYKQVQTVADSLSSAVSAVSRVALLSDNSVTMAVYLLALMLLHKEVLLLNVHLTPAEIRNQLDELDVHTVVVSDERLEQLRNGGRCNGVEHLSGIGQVIVFDEASIHSADSANLDVDRFDWHFNDSDIAAIMNTSATTGKFKSVPLRWGQIRAHVEASAQTLGVTPDDTWLMVLPLFHVSGLSILMRSLYNGTAVRMMEKLDRQELVRLVNDQEINMVSLVPTILKDVVGDIATHRMRVILLGGEFIPMPLVEACREKSLPIYKTYGMTETFSQSVTFFILDYPDKIESVGKPLPGMTVNIVNPDVDGVGEIHLTGPMLMDGYLNKEPIRGDFNTDDIGYVDEDGYVYILNRRKDIIISGGENIYPKEIEDLLYTLPYVKECAVVPVADEKWGQVPALFVAVDKTHSELSQDKNVGNTGKLTQEALVKQELSCFLSNHLARYKIPKYITILDSLPRNGTGKILRKDLQIYAESRYIHVVGGSNDVGSSD